MNKQMKWTSCWGNAISIATRRPENYAKNLTLRYPVKMLLNGNALRIRLDNFCGNEDVTVNASVARSNGNSNIDRSSVLPVTLGGNEK